jgi:hypothetical protein
MRLVTVLVYPCRIPGIPILLDILFQNSDDVFCFIKRGCVHDSAAV